MMNPARPRTLVNRHQWIKIETDANTIGMVGEMHHWAIKNCPGDFKRVLNTFYFEKEKDATLFALKWL
jgi:hypothetical protein